MNSIASRFGVGTAQWKATAPVSASASIVDAAILTTLVLTSLAMYVSKLGFYSDDWAFLSKFYLADDQSVSGLYHAVRTPLTTMRPVQLYYLALLYSAFGLNPLGYHLVNAVVLSTGVILFYLTLRELHIPRLFTTSIPLLYALLPHYTTDRFWVAAFQAHLSMALYFAGTYFVLHSASRTGWQFWKWQAASVAALLGSALAYEVFLPLFIVNVALAYYLLRGMQATQLSSEQRLRFAFLAGAQLLVFFAAAAFKANNTIRMGNEGVSFLHHLFNISRRAVSLHLGEYSYGFNIWRALEVNYGQYGVRLPWILTRAIRDYSTPAIRCLAIGCSLLVFGWIYHLARAGEAIFNRRALLITAASGFALFWLGYAVFLTNYNIGFTTTGIANRTSIAAAVGLAISAVGAAGLLCSIFSNHRIRRLTFSALMGALCGAGFLLINVVALFWVAAYEREQQILARIQQRLPGVAPGSTLILDGVCPYAGPAVVFEAPWDLTGALAILYKDKSRSFKADIVTRNLKVEKTGISTTLYRMNQFYPYDRGVIVFDDRSGAVHVLTDLNSARSYFDQSVNNGDDCPIGVAGRGVPIF